MKCVIFALLCVSVKGASTALPSPAPSPPPSLNNTPPSITIIGETLLTIVQSNNTYIDAGAQCHDNGLDISYMVEVSTQLVNLNKVGTYSIYYTCPSEDGTTITTKTRVVNVVSNLSD
jgi:hypothetical protein